MQIMISLTKQVADLAAAQIAYDWVHDAISDLTGVKMAGRCIATLENNPESGKNPNSDILDPIPIIR